MEIMDRYRENVNGAIRRVDYPNAYKHVLIYHHFDADGYCAAAVIGCNFLMDAVNNTYKPIVDLRFHSVEHSTPMGLMDELLAMEDKGENSLIFILDYSFPEQDYNDIRWATMVPGVDIVWIDHHESSRIQEADPIFGKLPGIRVLEKGSPYAGCALALYWWACQDKWSSSDRDQDDMELDKWYATLPCYYNVVKLVSDHDTFTHQMDGSSELVKWANLVGLYETFIDYQFHDDEDPSKGSLIQCLAQGKLNTKTFPEREYIEKGKNLTMIDAIRNKRSVKTSSWESILVIDIAKKYIDPEGALDIKTDDDGVIRRKYKVLCMNRGGNSQVFGDKFYEYDAVVLFTFDGESFRHSMFSRKENGAECFIPALFMKHFFGLNGGGHEHAAGWNSKEIIFWKGKPTSLFTEVNGEDPRITINKEEK